MNLDHKTSHWQKMTFKWQALIAIPTLRLPIILLSLLSLAPSMDAESRAMGGSAVRQLAGEKSAFTAIRPCSEPQVLDCKMGTIMLPVAPRYVPVVNNIITFIVTGKNGYETFKEEFMDLITY